MNIRSITVAGRTFSGKTELQKTLTATLKEQTPGVPLPQPAVALFLAVLPSHPAAADKIGTGIRSLRVELHPVFRTPVLMIERHDGSVTDISYAAAIARIGRPANDNEPETPETGYADFVRAAREAVRPQIEAFRREAQARAADSQGRVHCAISGDLLPLCACDVDHGLPWDFSSILEAFVHERQFVTSDVEIHGFEDGAAGRRFADPTLAADFAGYHFARATLRIVERKLHRRITAEARRGLAPKRA
jgi:hypothetical protein